MKTKIEPASLTRGSQPWLLALVDETNELIQEAKHDRHLWPDSDINWAGFSCYDASWSLHAIGVNSAEVVLSEASPEGNHAFTSWLSAKLNERGFGQVFVRTEW